MPIRVFYILTLLLSSLFLQVAEAVEEAGSVRIVCVFPEPHSKWAMPGDEKILLVGIENERESNLDVLSIQARIFFDLDLMDYYFPLQAFNNATVPPFAQATFSYIITFNRFFMPPVNIYIAGTIVYEIEQRSYQATFPKFPIEFPLTPEHVCVVIAYIIVVVLLSNVWAARRLRRNKLKTKRAQNTATGTNTAATGTSDTSATNTATGTNTAAGTSDTSSRRRQKTATNTATSTRRSRQKRG